MARKHKNITLSFCRYVGICAGIKILALALFLVDWWLVRRRHQLEEQATMTVGDLVGSIISLDKCKLYMKYRSLICGHTAALCHEFFLPPLP